MNVFEHLVVGQVVEALRAARRVARAAALHHELLPESQLVEPAEKPVEGLARPDGDEDHPPSTVPA